MNPKVLTESLRERFPGAIEAVFEKSAKRLYLDLRAEVIADIAEYLFRELGARFNTASGVDCPEHMEILYHFTLDAANLVVSLRVVLPKEAPVIQSLTPVITATHWIEREMHEMLGIDFTGHPQLERLLLPDEWPEKAYPLRKDYEEWDDAAVRDRGV